MKKFIGTMLMVISTILMITTCVTTFIFGGKMIITLIRGVFDLYLGIGFTVSLLLFGFFVAIMRVFGDMCDVSVELSNDDYHPKADIELDE